MAASRPKRARAGRFPELEALCMNAPFAMAFYRPDGRLALVNAAFEGVVGCPAPARFGARHGCADPECGLRRFWRLSREAFKGGMVSAVAFSHHHAGAKGERRLRGWAYPVLGRRGGMRYVALAIAPEPQDAAPPLAMPEDARYRDIVESSLAGIWTQDAEGIVTYANRRMGEILGAPPEALIGRAWSEFVPPHAQEIVRKQRERRRQGFSDSYELEYRRVDGSPVWTHISAIPLMDSAGVYTGSMAIVTDISARERAEAALRESEARYRRIVEDSPEGIFEVDADFRITFANPGAADMLGVTPEDLAGRPILDFVSPAERADAEERQRRRVSGQSERHVRRYVRADGTEITVYISSTPILGTQGEFKGAVNMMADITPRLKAEEALRRSEENYRQIVEHALEGILTLDARWCISFANQRAADMLGETPQSLLGRPILDFVHPDERGDALERQARRQAGAAERLDRRYLRRDGTEIAVHISSAPVFDAAGAFAGAVNLMTDLTPRMRAEQALRESEERYRLIVENSFEGIWTMDAAGVVTFANRRMGELLGTAPEALVGRPVLDFVPAHLHGEVAERMRRRRRGLADTYALEFRRADGGRLLGQVSAVPVFDSAGEFTGVTGMVTDVTERERALAAQREADARYRRIVENSFEGIWSRDAESRITFANRRMAEILGGTPEQIMGRSVLDFLHPEDHADFQAHLARRQAGQSELFDRRYRRLDGGTVWCQVSTVPVLDDSGGYLGSTDMVVDVTARRELEQQFLQAQKMEAVGRLAGGIAHDFNNMLTVVLGYTHLLLAGMGPGHPQRGLAEEVGRAAARSANLARRLLAFSRHQPVQARPVVLSDLVEDMAPMLHQLLGADVELLTRLAAPLPAVMADPGQLEQVIMNLAVNARDAMPGGGRLTIETTAAVLDDEYAQSHLNVKPGRYARLTVADTGTGIPPSVREHLFEPFFTTKAPGKGTGLGLSTVYGIVRNSGGHIQVESEQGRGTRFILYFPQAGTAEPAPEEKTRTPAAGGSETILLVEDEDSVRDLVRLVLEDAGYHVLTARDGAEALDLCGRLEVPPDLLLTDLMMPRMNGVELAGRVRQWFTSVKTVFMSGHVPESSQGAGVPPGARLIQKPVLPGDLRESIRRALDERDAP